MGLKWLVLLVLGTLLTLYLAPIALILKNFLIR
ncbi:hypothetical protein Q427_23810 [Halomonas sp. BC04]|nr:hypothetical protein Q427_23810 [Halomonas sp. BC04]